MGGPNLEIFKFSVYLICPIFALVHFGDPDWYRKHVVPVRVQFLKVCLLAQIGVTSIVTNYSLPLNEQIK